MHPTISFEIQLPPNSEIRNDSICAGSDFNEINADPGELNKQVAFFLVFNSFGPLGTPFSANQAVGGIFVSSISGYISGAISNQFST